MGSGQMGMREKPASVKSMYQSRSENVDFHKSFCSEKKTTVNIHLKKKALKSVGLLVVLSLFVTDLSFTDNCKI